MVRVLLTSFEPFGEHRVNSSLEVGRALAAQSSDGLAIDWLVLPVIAVECVDRVWNRIEARPPDLVLALGQAGISPLLRLEDRAVNFDDFGLSDNGGNRRHRQSVLPAGPALYRTAVPVLEVVERLRRRGEPVEVSYSAGSYVCNHLYYHLLHRTAGRAPQVLFVHLPLLPDQKRPVVGLYSRGLEEQVECLRAILQSCAWSASVSG